MSSLIKTAQSIIHPKYSPSLQRPSKVTPFSSIAQTNTQNKFDKSKSFQETNNLKNSFIPRQQDNDQLDIIHEANKIIIERTKNNAALLNNKSKLKNVYLNDTKEICLKNYLIDLLKEKRTDINEKERMITKALRDSERRLDGDYKEFVQFVEDMKNKQKSLENELIDLKVYNEENKKKEKLRNQEAKQIMDEVERTVKAITNLKQHAVFVHKVMRVPALFSSSTTEADLRDKNYEMLAENILTEFRNVKLDNNDYPDFLREDLMSKFSEFESQVIKLLEKQQQVRKEIKQIQENNAEQLEELKNRELDCKEECTKLKNEYDDVSDSLKALRKHQDSDNSLHLNFIYELYLEAKDTNKDDEPRKNTYKKKSQTVNKVKETMDILRDKERMVNDYISELEAIDFSTKEERDLLYDLIEDRKVQIRVEKQKQNKKDQELLGMAKRHKAEERSQRLIIRGRKVAKEYHVAKGKKKQVKKEIDSQDEDENQIIHYSSDEV